MTVQQSTGSAIQESPRKGRMLRVRVVDHTNQEHPTVNVRMPVSLVKWGMKMGQAFSPQLKDVDLDWDSINTLLEQDELGKIVEVEDETQHKTVEVWVE